MALRAQLRTLRGRSGRQDPPRGSGGGALDFYDTSAGVATDAGPPGTPGGAQATRVGAESCQNPIIGGLGTRSAPRERGDPHAAPDGCSVVAVDFYGLQDFYGCCYAR